MPFKKVNAEELRSLSEVFEQAGARDPQAWAHSQLSEGIPQLAIFSFAKALWKGVVTEDDDSWIEDRIEAAAKYSNEPLAQIGAALQEMLSKGVSRAAITDLVRVLQYDTLFHTSLILDGALEEDVPITQWALHQVDDEGKPVAIIQGLHEVLLGLDPTGREMRPRESNC